MGLVKHMLLLGLGLNPISQFRHLVKDAATLTHEGANLAISVHHRGVVTPTKLLTNLRQGQIGQFST